MNKIMFDMVLRKLCRRKETIEFNASFSKHSKINCTEKKIHGIHTQKFIK